MIASIAAILPACARDAVERADRPQTVAQLNRITEACGLPRSRLSLEETGAVHVKPQPSDKYEAVTCMLTKLKDVLDIAAIGFVGNEAPTEDDGAHGH